MFFAQVHEGKIMLSAPDSTAEIWPACGAILNSWQVRMGNNSLEVIDGYESIEDFKNNAESKGFRSCKMSPFVCRLNNGKYHFNQNDYALGKFYLGKSSIHGIVYNEPFELVSTSADENHALAVLSYVYNGKNAGYPFRYAITITYLLQSGGRLSINTTIENLENNTIPVADGWHPYFCLGDDINNLSLKIFSNQQVAFNKELIPTGELLIDERFSTPSSIADTQLDHCFLLHKPLLDNAACVLTNNQLGYQLTVLPNENYPYLQLYTPPQRKSIAIENLSAAPDAFNNHMGLVLLDSNEKISFSTTYQVTSISQ